MMSIIIERMTTNTTSHTGLDTTSKPINLYQLDGHGNKQWRHEKSQHPSNVIGSYGFKDKDGITREVEYVADKYGFRARIKTNEPGTAPKDPGDVKFEASPVVVSNHIRHTGAGEQTGPGAHERQDVEGVYKYGGQDNSHNSGQRIQHRMGRVGRLRAAASRPRYVYLPYHD
ncbi:unnamed protein product [Oppiella nova]|uniref:Cuticle protein n=1 Tax=Oppiella nova TaxID=334625 RepID=A0A7R9QQL3_9ACAR|nr:unnamed protein product [Oppiella nova]CAG2170215.1 unnamed protein product [Oppiella nova]